MIVRSTSSAIHRFRGVLSAQLVVFSIFLSHGRVKHAAISSKQYESNTAEASRSAPLESGLPLGEAAVVVAAVVGTVVGHRSRVLFARSLSRCGGGSLLAGV